MLDLFAGQLGWSKAFLARGWEVVAIDLVEPAEIPQGCTFHQADVRNVVYRDGEFCVIDSNGAVRWIGRFDFGCGSSPCEKFSVFGMAMFHPDPPYPFEGIELFNHSRALFEKAKIPYVLENVRPAWKFVGPEVHRCGPFSLWGKGVPPLLPQGIKKGIQLAGGLDFSTATPDERKAWRKTDFMLSRGSKSQARRNETAKAATIPPELANCVAEYAERIIEAEKLNPGSQCLER